MSAAGERGGGEERAGFEQLESHAVWSGRIGTMLVARFRYDDGGESEREIFAHPGAVGIVAHDSNHVHLVRQPREATGARLLELPAGKLDEPGEEPLDCARRELAEEVGLAAESWRHLHSFHSSPGFTDELVHLYLATGLRPARAQAGEEERIEVVRWPLDALDEAIAACRDSKSLIGLLLLARVLAGQH